MKYRIVEKVNEMGERCFFVQRKRFLLWFTVPETNTGGTGYPLTMGPLKHKTRDEAEATINKLIGQEKRSNYKTTGIYFH